MNDAFDQSKCGWRIKFGNGAARDKWQRSGASDVKSEETLVLTQSAIGEIKVATELRGTIGRARRVSCVRREEILESSQNVIGEIKVARRL